MEDVLVDTFWATGHQEFLKKEKKKKRNSLCAFSRFMCNGFQLNLMTVDCFVPSKRRRLSLESAEISPSWTLKNGFKTCKETLPGMALIMHGCTINW